MTIESLSEALGQPLISGKARIWLSGIVYQWSPVFERWVERLESVSFKPGELIPDRADSSGCLVAVIDR